MLAKDILAVVPYSIRTIRRISAQFLESGMTFQQYRILLLINRGKGQTEMTEILQVSMAAVSKMIANLVNKNLVERHPCEDRRRIELMLTAEGARTVKDIGHKLEHHLEKKIKKLTEKESSDLQAGLRVLEKLMGQFHED